VEIVLALGYRQVSGGQEVVHALVRMFVQDRRDRYALLEVAQGRGGLPDWMYGGWTLMADRKRFFRYRTGQHPPFIAFD
jgi:hypothetical protein